MSRKAPPSEIRRLALPVARLIDGAWQRMHWWIVAMAVLYALSGITRVRPDEVAIVLRWGRLVGDTPALQQHGPGLMFAFPRPIDEVVRVKTKSVQEVIVVTLAPLGISDPDETPSNYGITIDPLMEGYALSGDDNVIQLSAIARYRVRDPVDWQFYAPKSDDILKSEITQALTRTIGEMPVDYLLAEGRKDLVATVTRRAQEGLDAVRAGLELTGIELTSLGPPPTLQPEFSSVQTAFIGAETQKKDALAFAAAAAPQASAEVDVKLQGARAQADSALALARGEATAFRILEREYRASPAVVHERLYRDGIERALGQTNVRWLPPPPAGGRYNGLRVTIPGPNSSSGTPPPVSAPAPEAAQQGPVGGL